MLFSPALEKLRYSRFVSSLYPSTKGKAVSHKHLYSRARPARGLGMVAASLSLGLGQINKHREPWVTSWAVSTPPQPHSTHHWLLPLFLLPSVYPPFSATPTLLFISPLLFSLLSLSFPPSHLSCFLPPSLSGEGSMENQGFK